jgi:hypothetical protein
LFRTFQNAARKLEGIALLAGLRQRQTCYIFTDGIFLDRLLQLLLIWEGANTFGEIKLLKTSAPTAPLRLDFHASNGPGNLGFSMENEDKIERFDARLRNRPENCLAFERGKVFDAARGKMKKARHFGIALLAILVAIGVSSCCSVRSYLAFRDIGPDAIFQPKTSSVYVTLILRNIAASGSIKWEIASEQMCTHSSGVIRQDIGSFEQTWDMGTPEQRIWFWWGALEGEADATVMVNNIVLFQGHCSHSGPGKVAMIATCIDPQVYKTGGTGPYLKEPIGLNETNIVFATSNLPPRFGAIGN